MYWFVGGVGLARERNSRHIVKRQNVLSEQPEEGLRDWPKRREEAGEGENGGGRAGRRGKAQ